MTCDFYQAATDLALGYAINVFPIAPGRKTPLTPRGCLDAASSELAIAEWADRWPNANVGVACGSESGVSVVDVDVKASAPGVETMKAHKAAGRTLPRCPTVRTPSGGLHFWFRHVPGLKNAAGITKAGRGIGPGIDFRSDGGYVVAPPSRLEDCEKHGTGEYRWLVPLSKFEELPELPAWVVEALSEPWRPRPKWTPVRTDDVAMRKLETLARVVATAKPGERNSKLYWAARRAIEAGLPRDAIEDRLAAAALSAGPDRKKILSTIESALRGAGGG